MTPEDAAKVVKIMLTVDSWCSNCQFGVIDQFKRAFPEHAKIADDLFARKDNLEDASRIARNKWEDGGSNGEPPNVWDIHVY